jgi:hypothetical protein
VIPKQTNTNEKCKICGDIENHRSKSTLFEGIGAIRKDFEARGLIAIDLNHNGVSLPRMEICEKCTVLQLKECISSVLKEENNIAIEAKDMRLSVFRSSKDEKETKKDFNASGALWYQFNSTKILDPRVHDGRDAVFVNMKKSDKSVKRIVSLQVEKEMRDDNKNKEVMNVGEDEEKEEEKKEEDDGSMFGLDDVREAELRKHPKYRPQKSATVMGLKWDLRDSSFLANNQDMSRRRVGILYVFLSSLIILSHTHTH